MIHTKQTKILVNHLYELFFINNDTYSSAVDLSKDLGISKLTISRFTNKVTTNQLKEMYKEINKIK